MEDSFRVRLDRAFASLSATSSSPSSAQPLTSSSLWCLTDEEIQRRQWTRESDASIPAEEDDDDFLSSSVDQFFFAAKDKTVDSKKNPNPNPSPNPNPNYSGSRDELKTDLKELDVEKSSPSQSRCQEDKDDGDDEMDVLNSIGMDCTLDFEEEEDEYDKVAVGREKVGDRLYMSDVIDYTPHLDNYNELPNTFGEACRDPRANHLAAKLRLKEDAEAARSFNSLHVSDQTEDDFSGTQNNASEDENFPKSILKRKDDQMDMKTGKRVRFDSTCKSDDHAASEGDKIVVSEYPQADYSSSSLLGDSSVPDYVRHPLRYTHYTFDASSDMNEESNRQAYMDFLNMVQKSKSERDEIPADLTKPVIFNPKKKAGDTSRSITMGEHVQRKSAFLSIAAGNTEEVETSEMEVDEQETADLKVGNGKRSVRKYRAKFIGESNEADN